MQLAATRLVGWGWFSGGGIRNPPPERVFGSFLHEQKGTSPSRFCIVTLRLCATRGFPPTRAGLRAALRPCARPRFAPSSPARGLRASCHAAARSRPGRFRCDSGHKQPGCARLGLYPSLRSKLPCSRPPRFLLSRCGGCATRGFPPTRNTNARAFSPPWFVFLAPVHPRCSARLRASS